MGGYWTAFQTFDWRFGGANLWAQTLAQASFSEISLLFVMFGNAASAVVLLTLCGHVEEETAARVPASKALRRVAKVAAIAWGVWVALRLVGLLAVPFTVPPLLSQVADRGLWAREFAVAVWLQLRDLLLGAAFLVGPYVILKSTQGPAPDADTEESGEPEGEQAGEAESC